MRNLFKNFICFVVLMPFLVHAQDTGTIIEYIDKYKDLAIAEMKRTGVPAAVKLAQGIHETGAGTSNLVMKSNNHFGIKCKTGWSGPSVSHDDDARNECFRKYESPEDSYRDHSNFLKGNQRYAGLFKLDPADYEGWAWGLRKAGYATNPKYAQAIIQLIEEYGLQQYSLMAMGKPTPVTKDLEESLPLEKSESNSLSETQPKKSNKSKESKESLDPQSQEPSNTSERYPSGIFRQNGRRAIFVQKGTPYLAVANQCKLPLSRLFEYNELAPSVEANSDELLFLEKKNRKLISLPSLSGSKR